MCYVNSQLQLGPRGRVGRRQLDQLEHAAELQLHWLWYDTCVILTLVTQARTDGRYVFVVDVIVLLCGLMGHIFSYYYYYDFIAFFFVCFYNS